MTRAIPRPDWALAEAPAQLATPWATAPALRPDGMYVEAESGVAASLAAWQDRIARHHEQGRPLWRRSPGGVVYIPDGERFAFLWPVLDIWTAGAAWSSGPARPERLLHSVGFTLARRAAEEWVLARRTSAVIDVDSRLASR